MSESSAAGTAACLHDQVSTTGGAHLSRKPGNRSAADTGFSTFGRRVDSIAATVVLLIVGTGGLSLTALLTPAWVLPPAVLVVLTSALLVRVLHRAGRDLARQDDALRRTITSLRTVTTERNLLHSQQTELLRLAHHDPVTGLGNRLGLDQRGADLGNGLETAALLLLDLDGFKEVNDTLGHALGDDLLRQVGHRLTNCVRSVDDVVRMGGDEFVVLLADTSAWTAAQTAERILDAIRRPFQLAEQSVQVRGSVGLVAGSTDATLHDLLQYADVAMYAAKAEGKDRFCAYEPSMISGAAERFTLDAEVRKAMINDEFEVYYQPIVDASTGRVESVEALVRWEHPTRGTLSPVDFLASADRSGLVVELGQFVLRAACEQTAAWRRRWPWLSVAVNASHRELMHEEFAAQVTGILMATGLTPSALCIEVTETVLAIEDDIDDVLRPLRALGVHCSLDDFGTGQSSLSRLSRVTVDKVKIDKSFVGPVKDNSSSAAPLLASIVHLSHSLGLQVVAEGVETRGQADFLIDQGCDQLQGYLFARPQPAAACHLGPDVFQPDAPAPGINPAPDVGRSLQAEPVP